MKFLTVIHKINGAFVYSCRFCGIVCKNKDEPLKVDGKEACGECWFKLTP